MNIKTEDIAFSIEGKEILQQVSLAVAKKEFVGIIGPNGSGKSTLLKCIYRVLKPDTGAIFFDGKNLTDMSLKESALKVAVMAQHNYYNFDFTVESIVLMGRAPHKKLLERDNARDYEIARKVLHLVGLENMGNRKFSTLSGGEQQRVILARTLTQDTPCLIMDEPTNHLDIKYQLQLMEILKKLHCTTLAAFHDLNIAALYCDRIIALKDGRIVGNNTPKNLLTAEFISDLYEVQAEVYLNQSTGRPNIVYIPPG